MDHLIDCVSKRLAVLMLVLVVALFAVPFSATQTAYAGGSYDYNFVTGANDDGTVYPGSKLKVDVSSLTDIFGSAFLMGYMNGEIEVVWRVGDANEPDGFDGGAYTFSYTVKDGDVGKEITFFTLSVGNVDTSYNNNSPSYKVIANPESGGSGESESGGSGESGGSESTTPSGTAPSLKDVVMEFDSVAAGEIRLTLLNNGSDSHSVYGVQVKYNGNIVWNADSHNYAENKYVTVPYGQTVKFEYRVYRASKYNSAEADRVYSEWTTASAISKKLAKPKVSVTKISAKKAGIKWEAVAGATGYKVYANNKLIKTLSGSKLKYVYTKAGAGSKKYSVQAVIKNSAMSKAVKGPKSAAKKGKSNTRKYSYSKNPKTKPSFTAKFDVAKITLKGNTYTVTGYVLNNRIYDLQKYKRLDFTIYCDGKKVAHKVFKNLKCSVGAGDYKKMTIKLKGKGGVDFRNADGITFRYEVQPYWKGIGVWTP